MYVASEPTVLIQKHIALFVCINRLLQARHVSGQLQIQTVHIWTTVFHFVARIDHSTHKIEKHTLSPQCETIDVWHRVATFVDDFDG